MRVSEAATPLTAGPARLRQDIRVPFHDAGPAGHVGIMAIANYLQQSAALHAEQLGVAAERLAQDRLFWVLTRMFVRIVRAPMGGEPLVVETWPSQRPRQLFLRDFRIATRDGDLLVAATSSWALIDATNRKAIKGPEWIAALVTYDPERALEFPARSPRALATNELACEIHPRHADLDLNGHVNNASLMGWLLEVFGDDWFAKNRLTALDIAFRSECRRGDIVRSCASLLDKGHVHHTLTRTDGLEIARAMSWWDDGV